MPNRDKTGPMGQGPATGRGFGPCGKGKGQGFGFRLGRGFARGLCRFQSLIDYRKALEKELEDVKKQEKELK
ncbi:MAG: DUF5320 domain-containing protein [Candidatus Shapirobacteria bacterium]|nr:DUF5320 domain-containing protein [Candidatus Shapirobacteria bacterium]